MKTRPFLLLFAVASLGFSQTTVEQRLRVKQNECMNGGVFLVEVSCKGTNLPEARTIASIVMDITYDHRLFQLQDVIVSGNLSPFNGYIQTIKDSSTHIWISLQGTGVDGGFARRIRQCDGETMVSWYNWIADIKFRILDQTQPVNFSIVEATNKVGLFENPGNDPLTDVIIYQTLSPPQNITDVSMLPVEMTGFAGAVNFRDAKLTWNTETESNNYGFEIERREVGKSASVWAKVGFVPGAGTSTARRDYSFTDASLAPGRYAYQVKQVDIDGSFQYSGSLEVEVGVAGKVLSLGDNYPNPFNPSTSIEFSVPADGKVMLKVFNVLGQEVATLFDGVAEAGRFHQARFDASSLPTGLYFSRLEYDGKSMMKKMLLTK